MLQKSPKYLFYLVYFGLLIFVAVHFIMNFGLSFVNEKGCYRTYTKHSGNLTEGIEVFYNKIQEECQTVSTTS